MDKKKLLIGLLIIGVIVIAGIGYLVYSNLSEQPTATVEQTENLDATALLDSMEPAQDSESTATEEPTTKPETRSGTFQDADAVHSGSGTATITETPDGPVLVFSEDFSTTSGPDLFVYLSPNKSADPLGEFVSLGELKSNSGAQAYNLPDNYQDFESVTVWCRAFGVKFTYANLE